MNLYTDEGWLDIEYISTYCDYKGIDQIFIVGARGTGKSYGIQKRLILDKEKFIYTRISGNEIKMINNPEMNPFNAFYDDPDFLSYKFDIKKIPMVDNGLYLLINDKQLGICLPLTTFGKFRGMDFHEYRQIFLDEFIPERTIKKTPGIGQALKQAYETVNRNRELKGEKPVRLWAAANSLDLNNEILLEFQLIPMMEKLIKSDKEVWQEGNKLLIYPQHSPISEKKAGTSLYKNDKGSFSEMALKNQFREYSRSNLGSRSLTGAEPKFTLQGKFSVYRLQNRSWYVTTPKKMKELYPDKDFNKMQMIRKYYFLAELYLNGRIIFESPELELLFQEAFKIKL